MTVKSYQVVIGEYHNSKYYGRFYKKPRGVLIGNSSTIRPTLAQELKVAETALKPVNRGVRFNVHCANFAIHQAFAINEKISVEGYWHGRVDGEIQSLLRKSYGFVGKKTTDRTEGYSLFLNGAPQDFARFIRNHLQSNGTVNYWLGESEADAHPRIFFDLKNSGGIKLTKIPFELSLYELMLVDD
ncbi:hypothetical protein A3J90_01255 [candidate division WOR-1 bacterium RIFOXYC2_FULL_37_10]|uniref:Uncharacterized protein n=1 Tax=candidate division WOR-1 bacterium RIFOXYB2_FULL_37_13 TaxID=1802579 RepID=A0A1F4SSX8_UNCSA|nr:MAG: hypothetical protein A2246_01760 [candidate division WOR-1 bacterium RIFOXYA2_FULL_37_7]OGC23536.1 MAG: hypothetical protein A2310_02920 [candidate division WOR-1 bacterium RIFOXYB2_FULL_37_13]OGC35749.1 MAG: hypothetical protein A3J90_01255 [candidate division WOR-1 bacterium RIFOXYC2_FULL_37_10]